MPKTVQLSDDAYATLAALKREGESFSDLVKRLSSQRKDPRKLVGLHPPDPSWDYGEFKRKMDAADKRKTRK